jgi:NADH-quinone oxidoreductase subunit N
MNLLPFLAAATVGAILAVALQGRRPWGMLVGFAGVTAALVALVLAPPGEPLPLAGGVIAMTAYARVLIGVGLAGGLLVLAVSALATWEAPAPAALLVAVAGLAVALGVGGALPGLLAVGATSALAAAVALAHPATPLRVRVLAREMRGATLAMTVGILAVSLAPEAIGGLAVQPQVAGLAAVAAGLALGHRFGAIPFHARVARLPDAAPAAVLPALLALIPAGWAVVLLGWAPDTLGPAAPVIGWDGTLLVIVALATLVLGTLAALIQDDLLRIVAYTVVLDAGVVLLGFSSLDPGGREAVRAWLVPFVASRAALVGWVIAFRAAFGTARLSESRGWLRRAPTLGVGLVVIAAATVGWPGVLVWDARLAALQAATGGLALLVATLAALGTTVAVARILGMGFGRPEPLVAAAPGELARVPAGLRAAARALRRPEGRRLATLRAASHEVRPLLEMNRTPLRALLVVLLAGLALMTAVGAFGIQDAAAEPDLPVTVAASATADQASIGAPGESAEGAEPSASPAPSP